jgi:hypothetical protein
VTTQTDLAAAYGKFLAGNAPVHSSGQANDAFELYTLCLVLQAAGEEGSRISFESSLGVANPSALRFRTSPDRIFSTTADYTHAVIEFADELRFEAHMGVYVEGLAGGYARVRRLDHRSSRGSILPANSSPPEESQYGTDGRMQVLHWKPGDCSR